MRELSRELSTPNLSVIESHGQRIYQTNPFIRDIATFMESPENRDFYRKYMTNPTELEQTLLFLSVYDTISKKSPKLNGLQKISLLKIDFKDPKTRSLLAQHMSEWLDHNTPTHHLTLHE